MSSFLQFFRIIDVVGVFESILVGFSDGFRGKITWEVIFTLLRTFDDLPMKFPPKHHLKSNVKEKSY